ncbi:capsid protein [Mycobacterium sp. 852002-51961_SCH5331710]|nr:phage major capsid protein [Mycobacterium sp. 852002-51961_SCH5331710]OBB42696.1 capsid protein [Mycobacterium sp. 852002-51961_SCH5331710]
MAIEVTSGNTTLLQSEVASLLVQPLEQQSTFLSAGPTILNSASPVRVPRIASGVTAGFVSEGSQITDGSVDFDEVELLPSSLKSLKVLVRVSNEMIRQSVIGLEAVLRQRLVTDVSHALDAALWNGFGANEITGILQADGIAEGSIDLEDIDSLIDGIATAQANHVTPTHWAMNSATFNAFRKIKVGDTDARYVFDPSTVQNGTAFQLLGLPVIITDNVPAVTAALVDFSKVVVARDVDAEVKILDQTWGDYDSVGIRVVTRYDVALLQDKAVTLLTAGT